MAEELWNTVLKEIGEHLGESAGILLVIVSAAYLSSIFTATADLESSGNHDVVSFAVICLISVPVIANIGEVVAQAGDTISEIRTVMLSSIPGLCAMDMGSGAAGGPPLDKRAKMTYHLYTDTALSRKKNAVRKRARRRPPQASRGGCKPGAGPSGRKEAVS